MAAQATVSLEKAKRREPDKASIARRSASPTSASGAGTRRRRSSARCSSWPRSTTTRTTRSAAASRSRAAPRGERPLQARELAPSRLGAVPRADPRPAVSVRPVRAVCQRVARGAGARRRRRGGEIGPGLCVLLGVARGDAAADAERLAGKVARLRMFARRARAASTAACSTSAGGARRLAVHADRRHGEGEPAELLGCRAARAGGAGVRAVLRRAARRSAFRSRAASSARGWRSSSSTTGR